MTLPVGYSAREVARMLCKQGIYVTTPTVIRAAERGRLTAIKLAKQWFIVPDQNLEQFADALKRKKRGRKPNSCCCLRQSAHQVEKLGGSSEVAVRAKAP